MTTDDSRPIVERRRTDPSRRTAWIGLLFALAASLFFALLGPHGAVLWGAVTFGAVGLLLGPLTMTAFLTLAGIYRERYRRVALASAASGSS